MTRDGSPSRKGRVSGEKLFDASAIVNLLISRGNRIIDILSGNWILDLTIYEVGNAVWKLSVVQGKISSSEAEMLLDSLLGIVAGRMKLVLSSEVDHSSTLAIAREEKLSFYDASYLSAALERNLLLVTDDKYLYDAAKKHAKVQNSTDI